MRKLLLAALLLCSVFMAHAQSGTNSPYSQFGLGVLSEQTSGFNRGMNGVGLGFHEHNQVNYLNPASYSAIDSMTFIFDAGISGQVSNFSENGVRKNAKNANFEYVVAGFRAARHVGVTLGIIPFTNVGYNYTSTAYTDQNNKEVYYTNTYNGEGGIHQVFLGAGWQPVKGLSVGANLSYLWGNYTKYIANSYSNSYYNTLTRTYTAQVNSYKIDLGVQYTAQLSKHDWMTLGVTYSPGHGLGSTANMNIISTNSQTSTADTASFAIDKALKLPDMYGVGVMYNHNNQLKVGVDFTLQKWGSLGYPTFETNNNVATYSLQKGIYSDRKKINAGLQYCYGERDRRFLRRVQYRIGASYATSYYKVNGAEGPKEYSVSAGFGIPIINSYNKRSYLNISGQWVRNAATGLIKENVFRLNIGFTFNEDWFKKWKMD